MPKISVLMPVYNTKEEWLREAIESILNQTYSDFEFIIINDGSTNNAEEVILSYNDERIKYFKQENKGLATTLNKGIELATGEFIARMDSDDISLPQRFEKQLQHFQNHPELSIISCSYTTFPEYNFISLPAVIEYIDLMKCCLMCHPAIMMRRSDLIKYNLRYDSNFVVAQDYDLWSRAIQLIKLGNVQEVLLNYRLVENGNYKKNEERACKNVEIIKQNMLNFLTTDKDLQARILGAIYYQPPQEIKLKFLQKIFSVVNINQNNKPRKMITILGIKFKFRKKVKNA